MGVWFHNTCPSGAALRPNSWAITGAQTAMCQGLRCVCRNSYFGIAAPSDAPPSQFKNGNPTPIPKAPACPSGWGSRIRWMRPMNQSPKIKMSRSGEMALQCCIRRPQKWP